jgi:uncharacterized delta-60 repeat protein
MSVINRNRIITDGLVLQLDGINPKSITGIPAVNLSPPLSSWTTIRSTITLVTGGTITPPIEGAPVYKLVCGTGFVNTLHRLTNSSIFGTLGNGFYRYSLYVRGETTNNPNANFQIDIGDGSGAAKVDPVIIGTGTTWVKLSAWDAGVSISQVNNWFDFSMSYGSSVLANNTGDTYYISAVVAARSIGQNNNIYTPLIKDPGYIPYNGTTNLNWNDLSGFGYNTIITGNTGYDITTNSVNIYGGGSINGATPSRDIIFPTSVVLPGTGSSWTLNTLVKLNFAQEKTTNNFNISYALNKPGWMIWQMLHAFSVTKIVESNSNIYVSGNFSEYGTTNRPFIIKLNSGGTIDNTFNAGFVISQTQSVDDIVLNSSNEVYFNGFNLVTGALSPRVGKLNGSTGSFLTGITTNTMNATITLGNMVLDEPLNHLYVCGWFTSVNGVAAQYFTRLFSDTFTIDTSFNTRVGFNAQGTALAVALQPDKRVLVGGSFTTYSGESYNRIIRLTSGGTIDKTFVIGSGFAGGNVSNGCVKVQTDGKILVGGSFTSYSGVSANRIIRLNTDGSIDPTFVYGTGFNGDIFAMAIQPDNNIILGGSFSAYNGSTRGSIIRLTTGGTVDTSFVIGSGFNTNNVNAITIQSDGKILCGGRFGEYSGVTANNLIRLNTNGSIDTTFNSGVGLFGPYRPNLQIYYRNSSNALTIQTIFGVPPSGAAWLNYLTQSQYFNKFVMLTVVKDITDTYKTYWNGVSSGGGTSVAGSRDTGLNIDYIGQTIFDQSRSIYLSGNTSNTPSIGLYQVYNRELTPNEVLRNYNSLRTRYNL